jgi:4-hydroxy-tetrahydrodipicolinate reductase
MGTAVCEAVGADPALDLVAVVDPAHAGEKLGPSGLVAASGPEAMADAGAEVAVDFTVASAALANAMWCADNGVHSVIGTTGFSPAVIAGVRARFEAGAANCVVAPNFAIGAVLMMRFAELAAPFFETVEIIELHHDGKVDAPSGTAVLTAQRISKVLNDGAEEIGGPVVPAPTSRGAGAGGPEAARDTEAARGTDAARGTEAAPGVRVHSVRLRGLVAHQEVLFGTAGQTLTLRHDSMDRTSFMPGVLLAIKEVPQRRGLTIGLDALLGF